MLSNYTLKYLIKGKNIQYGNKRNIQAQNSDLGIGKDLLSIVNNSSIKKSISKFDYIKINNFVGFFNKIAYI